MKRLLALETSSEACSLALAWDGAVFSRHEQVQLQHAELLLPWVRELLGQANASANPDADVSASLQQLDAIVYGRGPGSFTSLRIGIGAVQGLAWGAELPVIPISSLAAVAEQVQSSPGQTILVAMDARMGEVFHGSFKRNDAGELQAESVEAVTAPGLVVCDDSANTIMAGNAFGRFAELDALAKQAIAVHEGLLPSAEALLSLAAVWLQQHQPLAAALAQAVYLRDNVADKPKSPT